MGRGTNFSRMYSRMSFSHGDKFIPEYAIFSNRKSHDHDKTIARPIRFQSDDVITNELTNQCRER